jgi:hypothetical protein
MQCFASLRSIALSLELKCSSARGLSWRITPWSWILVLHSLASQLRVVPVGTPESKERSSSCVRTLDHNEEVEN